MSLLSFEKDLAPSGGELFGSTIVNVGRCHKADSRVPVVEIVPVLPPQAWINPPLEKTKLHDAAQAPLAAASIPGVPPFSASRNQILVDVDVDRADLTSLPTIIEAH